MISNATLVVVIHALIHKAVVMAAHAVADLAVVTAGPVILVRLAMGNAVVIRVIDHMQIVRLVMGNSKIRKVVSGRNILEVVRNILGVHITPVVRKVIARRVIELKVTDHHKDRARVRRDTQTLAPISRGINRQALVRHSRMLPARVIDISQVKHHRQQKQWQEKSPDFLKSYLGLNK